METNNGTNNRNTTGVSAEIELSIDLENTGRSAEEALAECERELGVRLRCFGRWVRDGKIAKCDAKDRLQRLARAAQLLKALSLMSEAEIEKIDALSVA